jgi:uncharacterized membrane protein required for colicin V production
MLGAMNWLDDLILAYMVVGAWFGLRLGLVGTVASLAAYAAALAAAVRLGDPLLAAANACWDLTGHLARWLAGAAAPVPVLLPPYRTQLGVAAAAPDPAALERAAAALILHYAAFALVFLATRAAAWAILGPVVARAPRGGPAGFVNAILGLCAGAAERAAVAAVLLGLVASMGAIAALAPLSRAVAASRLAPLLLAAFRAWQPAAAHWWAAAG